MTCPGDRNTLGMARSPSGGVRPHPFGGHRAEVGYEAVGGPGQPGRGSRSLMVIQLEPCGHLSMAPLFDSQAPWGPRGRASRGALPFLATSAL